MAEVKPLYKECSPLPDCLNWSRCALEEEQAEFARNLIETLKKCYTDPGPPLTPSDFALDCANQECRCQITGKGK